MKTRAQSRQQYYRRLYQERHPEWRSSPALFRELVSEMVTPATRLLDVGCGSTDFMKDVYGRTPHTYGIDPDAGALARSSVLAHKLVAAAEDLPFADDFFDVVTMAWVIEHLRDPERAFREIHRVLKPGGFVVFLTPNVWNYNVWLIRAVPNTAHGFFTRRLYKRLSDGTFPTYYRLNSPSRLEQLLTKLGFERERLLLNGDASYLALNRMLFAATSAVERLLDLPSLRRCRVHLIGVYRKR